MRTKITVMVALAATAICASARADWTNGYAKDYAGMTAQDLLPGGDGQRILADGSKLNLLNSSKMETAEVRPGQGIYVSDNDVSGAAWGFSGPSIFWRLDEMGSAALTKGDYGRARVAIIFSMPHQPTVVNESASIGGFLGTTIGSMVGGRNSFNPALSSTVRFSCDTNYFLSSGAREGIFAYGGLGTPMQARIGDTGTSPVEGQKDMAVWYRQGGAIRVALGRSASGDFPADIDGAVSNVGSLLYGTPSVSPYVSFDVAAAWVAIPSGVSSEQDLLIRRIRVDYQ